MKILLPLVLLIVFSTSVKCFVLVDAYKYVLDAIYFVEQLFTKSWAEAIRTVRDKLFTQLKNNLYPFLSKVVPSYDDLRPVIEHAETLLCWITERFIDGIAFRDLLIFLRYFFGFMDSLLHYVELQVDKFKNFLNETLDKGAQGITNSLDTVLMELESRADSPRKTICSKALKNHIRGYKISLYDIHRSCIDELLDTLDEKFEYVRNLTVAYPQAALYLINRTSDCIDSISDSIYNIDCLYPIGRDAIEIGFTFFTAPGGIAKFLLELTTDILVGPGFCSIMMAGKHVAIRAKFENLVNKCMLL